MQVCIFGGSAGGKSEYAGRIAEKLAGGSLIRYIATMPEQGEGAREKIRRHEKLRQNGHYKVSLCLSVSDLEQVTEELRASAGVLPVVLLDSLDGLLADVIFGSGAEQEVSEPPLEPAENRLETALGRLAECAGHLIAVSDDFYRDGTVYDPQTEQYISAAGRLLQAACRKADTVIEVVYGIPVLVKPADLSGAEQVPSENRALPFGSMGEQYEFFEIPYHHDVNLYQDSHAAD
ncbi:MAG: bifunctional adenosylcobinamide kinase/adenosylcobinamide-phosphate guanylyltransferase [Firmicutes bacterium]|nr:bifunctional adenosylcobinamide kinase/adenosylcobinamide-phosphate guanylyltransferase [Bacillota bacterium]